jgi:hypothetical protein
VFCHFVESVGEFFYILYVNKDTLTLFGARATVNRHLGDGEIRLTLVVIVSVKVVDTSSGTDALCLGRFSHFDDVFDDVVGRARVELACRLFGGRDYLPTPGSTRVTVAVC